MTTVRTFIAIEMPHSVMEIVRQTQQVFRQAGIRLRWVRRENVHLTLRFLGDISIDAVPGIQHALERSAAETPAFSLQVKGIGAFPSVARPKVVWLGLQGQLQPLEDLYRRLALSLSEVGIPSENRPFRGHLTIGRVKDRIENEHFRSLMQRMSDVQSESFIADRLCFFKSDLTPGGAVYTPLAQAKIGFGNHSD